MKSKKTLIKHFSVIPDPRINRKKKHQLIDIIAITICGLISGCDSFTDIELYGIAKLIGSKKFLALDNGIPSHNTFGRVFSLISPLELQKAFYEWTKSIANIEGEIISIDAKYLRASHGATTNKRSIFGMVNAWPSNAGIALAQLRTDHDKIDEKQAFRKIIDFLELKGAIVTMYAAGCYSSITNKIVEKEGDFLVALKRNQRSLFNCVSGEFNSKKSIEISISETFDKGHGREEKRTCHAFNLSDAFIKQLEIKKYQKKPDTLVRVKIYL